MIAAIKFSKFKVAIKSFANMKRIWRKLGRNSSQEAEKNSMILIIQGNLGFD